MNALLQVCQQQLLAADAQLPGHDALSIRRFRQEAMQRALQTGLPTQQMEHWKYTPTRWLTESAYAFHAGGCVGLDPEDLKALLVARGQVHHLVFVNGLLSLPLSGLDGLPAGVQVESMARLARESPEALEPWLGSDVTGADQGLAALNQALWPDGAFVRLASGVQLSQPLQLLFLTTSFREPIVTLPWSVVILGEGARAQVIESYATLGQGDHFTNARTTLVLGQGAQLDHLLLLAESDRAHHVGSVQATQLGASRLAARVFAVGGALTRHELHVALAGAEAECHPDGLFVAGGRQHLELHSWIHHLHSHTRSQQWFKGVLDGEARGVFNGVVRVPQGVREIQARQQTDNLLLSDRAEIAAKPQLEIHSDAVQCHHGATVGSLDAEAIFYLRSRGLDEECARKLLVQGFIDVLLQRVQPAVVREWIARRLNSGEVAS
ncbi:MAG: Fe-S cluster assembly protein SufD [Magnetococcales bacterium]|nr:Fe-S cluster assembly protein SufD [Magnetococcales bacterium]